MSRSASWTEAGSTPAPASAPTSTAPTPPLPPQDGPIRDVLTTPATAFGAMIAGVGRVTGTVIGALLVGAVLAPLATYYSLVLDRLVAPRPHPMFDLIPGPVAAWERAGLPEE